MGMRKLNVAGDTGLSGANYLFLRKMMVAIGYSRPFVRTGFAVIQYGRIQYNTAVFQIQGYNNPGR